ncbi:hypothetical protein VV208B2_41260 [Vibrio vulnificus]|nr:hypothetical protein VV208B2_41260 [Vibrio vulnificus]
MMNLQNREVIIKQTLNQSGGLLFGEHHFLLDDFITEVVTLNEDTNGNKSEHQENDARNQRR